MVPDPKPESRQKLETQNPKPKPETRREVETRNPKTGRNHTPETQNPNPKHVNRYKLIKANSYSFPERLEISESGKRLIRKILQSNPEMRPTIDEVPPLLFLRRIQTFPPSLSHTNVPPFSLSNEPLSFSTLPTLNPRHKM
jgi:serine/threonine protein kinase